jgi:hypothetical protein
MRLFTNKTAVDVSVISGTRTVVVEAGVSFDLATVFTPAELAASTTLIELLGQGTDKYQLNDGSVDLTVTQALDLTRGYYPATVGLQGVLTPLGGNLVNIPFDWAASFGLIPGVISGRAGGYIGTAAVTAVAVRATAYAPQGANAQRSLKSSSANDAAAGSGARVIRVTYLNASFALHTEDVTLNGTNAVNTAGADWAFIERMEVISVGTQGGGNVGTISLYTQTGGSGSVWGSIAVGDNMTYWAHHYVPAGKTCRLLGFSGGATVVAGTTTCNRSGNPLTVTEPQRGLGVSLVHPAASFAMHDFRVPIALAGPDLIWLVERPNAATASTAHGFFEYVEF